MKRLLPLVIAVVTVSAAWVAQAADHSSGHGAGAPAADAAKPAVPANYPLKTCVVSDEDLGSMGEPFAVVHKEAGKPDRTVLLCCSHCEDGFRKDPAKALAKLDAAEKAAAAQGGAHAHGK